VELWFGGDLHLGDAGASVLEPLRATVAGAVGVVNLEGPVGEARGAGPRLVLTQPPTALAGLRTFGVQVVGVENNHRLDLGDEAAAQSDNSLRAAGFLPVGGGTLELSGRTVRFVAVDLSAGLPADLPHTLAGAGDLVVGFHTLPESYLPDLTLRSAVDLALDAGARVVVAHGSHRVGALERRGDAVIAWGLGNLAMSCPCTDEREALIVRVQLGDTVEATAVPIEAGLNGGPASLAPDPSGVLDLIEGLGGTPLRRSQDRAAF
jgi:Bacterial capsule synthesis protein PGA_cap